MKPRLLLVTNLANESTEDEEILGPALEPWFEVALANPGDAVTLLDEASICLIRNAWPHREMKADLRKLADAVRRSGVPAYNPLRPSNFGEDKSYLARLTREGLPVIPTVLDKKDIAELGRPECYLIKPLDACGSEGIQKLIPPELAATDIAGHVLQPLIEIERELSFFFIDGVFIYALRAKTHRWDMDVWLPPEHEIDWARQFVKWNKMPYGLQRIDAALRPNGEKLLMEIEDFSPFLSLQILPVDLRKRVIETLVRSLLANIRKS